MAGHRGSLGDLRDIAAKAIPAGELDRPTLQRFLGHDRRRQYARGVAVTVACQVVAQYHGPAFERLGKHGVVVQRRLQLPELVDKTGLVAQFALCQLIEPLQARALVGLGKHDVETQQRDLLALEQFGRQFAQSVASPGPAPYIGQAFLVDVDDHHAVVKRLGHRGAQTRVVDDAVQPVQHTQAHRASGVQQHDHQRKQRDENSRPVPDECSHDGVSKQA